MRGAVGIVVCSLGAAAALQPALCPTARAVRGNSLAISCSAVDRRSAVLGALGWGLLAAPAFAYDAIPEVSADFEALEKKRVLALAEDKIKTKELNKKVAVIESAETPQQFVAAADDVRAAHRTAAHPSQAQGWHTPRAQGCTRDWPVPRAHRLRFG